MLQGLIIGVVGTAVGAAAGYGISSSADRYKLIRMPDGRLPGVAHAVYRRCRAISRLVVGVAILICFVATIYPSRQAARLDPAQALRYE